MATQTREMVISYPAHNLWGVPIEYYERRVIFQRMDSMLGRPLGLDAILRRPRVRRGCTIITAFDVEAGVSKQFYVEAFEGRTLPGFRLSLWRPDEPEVRQRPIGPVFAPTAKDWALLVDAVRDILSCPEDFGDYEVAAFPVLD